MDTEFAPPASSARSAPSAASEVARRTPPYALETLVRGDGTIDWSPWYLTDEEDMGHCLSV